MNSVIAHKQVQIAVSDWRYDLVDVLEDFHNAAQPGTGKLLAR
jgi:hypothetical protein